MVVHVNNHTPMCTHTEPSFMIFATLCPIVTQGETKTNHEIRSQKYNDTFVVGISHSEVNKIKNQVMLAAQKADISKLTMTMLTC